MRILIFGCGYLGRRVAREWILAGHHISALTRTHSHALELQTMGITPLLGDVCEPATLANLPPTDLVLHSIGFDRNSNRTYEDVACTGMANVLTALDPHQPRFIHISSTSVYGQSTGEWVTEDSECCPTQVGGQLCLRAEDMVRDHFHAGKLAAVTTLRLAGIYGPDRLLSRIEALKSGSPIAGRSDSWLNLIHVEDAVRAVCLCAETSADSRVFNVVDNAPLSRGAYFNLLARRCGAPAPIFDADQPRSRGSGGLNKRCSNARLRQTLGWQPLFESAESGLPAAIASSQYRAE